MDINTGDYKELGCRDFGKSCDFAVRAKSDNEILDKCAEHACSTHGKCDTSSEMREKIRSRIRNITLSDVG